jgi:predicted nucleotidyltransferase
VVNEPKHIFRSLEGLSRLYNVHWVVLFGSRARGDYKPWSDYDILVIADFNEDYLERIRKIYEIVDPHLEVHPYRLDEALKMLERGVTSIVDALEDGVVIVEDQSITALREKYIELKRAGLLKRTKTSITIA